MINTRCSLRLALLMGAMFLFPSTGFAQVAQPSAEELAALDRQIEAEMAENIIPHRASGYWVDRMGVELVNRDPTQTSSTLGAGGIVSSARDMAKWDEALYGTQLLSDESKADMWTSTVLPDGTDTGYAFGWGVGPYRGRPSVGHGGQVAGFVANFTRLVEDEVAIIVFANRYRVSSGRFRDFVAETFLPGDGGE